MKQGRAAAAPPDSGFYHANNAKGTGLGETIPQPQLGPNTTFLRFRPTMRNVFGGLSFNLTRVAAEGAPGTSSHDCYDRSGGRRGETSTWCRTYQCVQSPTAAPSPLCACAPVCVLFTGVFVCFAADCCSRAPQHLSGFPGRKHASCSTVTFDSLRSETAHQFAYYVLKNPPSVPKSKGGKNPLKRQCLEIDSCYCAVPSGAFAREQKRVNIL